MVNSLGPWPVLRQSGLSLAHRAAAVWFVCQRPFSTRAKRLFRATIDHVAGEPAPAPARATATSAPAPAPAPTPAARRAATRRLALPLPLLVLLLMLRRMPLPAALMHKLDERRCSALCVFTTWYMCFHVLAPGVEPCTTRSLLTRIFANRALRRSTPKRPAAGASACGGRRHSRRTGRRGP